MAVLCVIPARGGSKGLPRKNLLPVGGVPLIVRAVRTALAARLVDRVVVSTDDAEISKAAWGAGAKVIDLSAELAAGDASKEPVLVDAVNQASLDGWAPDVLVCVQCTSPFTSPEDIDGTVDVLAKNSAVDSCLTVTPTHSFLWLTNATGVATGVNHNERVRILRQNLDPQYLETGAAYATRVPGFLATGQIHHGLVGVYVQPPERVLEIDQPIDLQRAELWAPIAEQPGR